MKCAAHQKRNRGGVSSSAVQAVSSGVQRAREAHRAGGCNTVANAAAGLLNREGGSDSGSAEEGGVREIKNERRYLCDISLKFPFCSAES